MKKISILRLSFILTAMSILSSCTQKKDNEFCSAFEKLITKASEKKLVDFKGENIESEIFPGTFFHCTAAMPGAVESMLYFEQPENQHRYIYQAVMSISKDKKEADEAYDNISKQIRSCVAASGWDVRIIDFPRRTESSTSTEELAMGFTYKNAMIKMGSYFKDTANQYICILNIFDTKF